MKTNMTFHASVERFDRICFLIDLFKGDFGKPLISIAHTDKPVKEELTSNGIVIVRNLEDVVITMYLCSIKKAQYFGSVSGKMLTDNQWKQIKANQKYSQYMAA